MKRIVRLKHTIQNELRVSLTSDVVIFLGINLGIVILQFIYLALRFQYLNSYLPFWYTKPWGELQLAPKFVIYILPSLNFILFIGAIIGLILCRKFLLRFSKEIILTLYTVSNIILGASLLRIIKISSVPFAPFINPLLLDLAIPFIFAISAVIVLTPRFIKFAKANGIVTDPAIHSHPGMLLTKPSARGGGIIFAFVFAVGTLLFVQPTREILGILIFTILLALFGLLDDYQNTHLRSKLRILESPGLRLGILVVLISVFVAAFGIRSDYISNPLGGIIQFDGNTVNLLGNAVNSVALVFTVLWIVWILNLLSWSNGIDGQFAGITGIVGILIAVLALRFVPQTSGQIDLAKLAVIMSGASVGMLFFTWNPSKIMWGFGAVSAGLVIAALSILINSKIATSVSIIIIPFFDAAVTFIRRIIQKKNPFKGDKGHLHHLLMERGWSIKRIAVFYWLTTAIFGVIGILTADKSIQVLFFLGGIVAFGIILLNVQSIARKQRTQKAA